APQHRIRQTFEDSSGRSLRGGPGVFFALGLRFDRGFFGGGRIAGVRFFRGRSFILHFGFIGHGIFIFGCVGHGGVGRIRFIGRRLLVRSRGAVGGLALEFRSGRVSARLRVAAAA